jgi:UDP-glucose 4-epimerase
LTLIDNQVATNLTLIHNQNALSVLVSCRVNARRIRAFLEPMNSTIRCCVIGGHGFIGGYLCPVLAASGREVLVLGRNPFTDDTKGHGVRHIECDGKDQSALRKALYGCDEIIDLAYSTVPKSSVEDPLFDLQSNLPRFLRLLETLRNDARVRRLLVVSSGGAVYGQPKILPITEDAPTNPISPYGVTKLMTERYAFIYHKLFGIPAIVVRPGNAYGKRQRAFTGQGFVATAMGHIVRGDEIVVFGEQGTVRDYIHVHDIARGIVAALNHGVPGAVYNIGSGVGYSNLTVINFIRPLAEVTGLPVRVRHAPAREFDVTSNVLSSDILHCCSGWKPKIPIHEGLADMWDGFIGAREATSRISSVG